MPARQHFNPNSHTSIFMNSFSITHYDRVTLRPLNELGALHEPDMTLQVVPAYEADADNGLISEEAPLGVPFCATAMAQHSAFRYRAALFPCAFYQWKSCRGHSSS